MVNYIWTAIVFALSFQCSFGQQKLEFKDGKTLTIQGKLVGTVMQISDGKETKKEFYYFHKEGGELTLSVYTEWISAGMDALKVYTFTIDQLGTTGLNAVSEYEADEYYKNIRYGFSMSTNSETPFKYLEYSRWSSVGEEKSFSLMNVYGEDKALVDALYAEINALLPIEKEEE